MTTEKKPKRPEEAQPISIRPKTGSSIHSLIAQIQELNSKSVNEIANEALERSLPELLKEEEQRLITRADKIRSKRLKE